MISPSRARPQGVAHHMAAIEFHNQPLAHRARPIHSPPPTIHTRLTLPLPPARAETSRLFGALRARLTGCRRLVLPAPARLTTRSAGARSSARTASTSRLRLALALVVLSTHCSTLPLRSHRSLWLLKRVSQCARREERGGCSRTRGSVSGRFGAARAAGHTSHGLWVGKISARRRYRPAHVACIGCD